MYIIYYKMVKQPTKRKPKKAKVVKKTKAKQIIKQKVVVNVGSAPRRRGRPRKPKAGTAYEPVQAGETIKEDRSTQQKFYDEQRASKPYVEEIKEDLKRLESGQEGAMKALMDMQKAGLALQFQQQQMQKQLANRPHEAPDKPKAVSTLLLAGESPRKRGGARAGAGRKPGSKNKPKLEAEAAQLGPVIEGKRTVKATAAAPPVEQSLEEQFEQTAKQIAQAVKKK
jgi:hypothetical protein